MESRSFKRARRRKGSKLGKYWSRDSLRSIVAVAYLVAAFVLGGASAAGALSNALLQLIGLVIIVTAVWTWNRDGVPDQAKALVWSLVAYIVLVGATLIPLPYSIWTALPGRSSLADALQHIGAGQTGMPLSLDPNETIASMLSLIPPLAMFLLTVQLSGTQRNKLAWVILIVAASSVVLGAFQLLGGQQSSLRLYQITNRQSPVGFFANVNHLVTLLLCSFPIAGYIAAKAIAKNPATAFRNGGVVLSVAIAIFLGVGIGIAGSLAGYGLLLPAALAGFLVYRKAKARSLGRITTGAMAAVAVAFIAFAAIGPVNEESLTSKFGNTPASRKVMAATTTDAIRDYFPAGTGLGTFVSVYRTYEDPAEASRWYVNHAHNDYLEFTLELGLPGLAILAAFILWWVWRSRVAWRTDFKGAALARCASVMIGVILLHSVVDYPLRTAALATLLALACGLLVPAPLAPRRHDKADATDEPRARHLRAD